MEVEVRNYSKLVRDGIIERIRRNGETVSYRRAADEEYSSVLADKLIEEAKEIREALIGPRKELVGEIADLCEVLDELLALHQVTLEEVQRAKERKVRERGGFKGRWILNIL